MSKGTIGSETIIDQEYEEVKFTWKKGGKKVEISGSFNEWKKKEKLEWNNGYYEISLVIINRNYLLVYININI